MKITESIINGRKLKWREGDVPSNNGELTHTLTIHKPAKGFEGAPANVPWAVVEKHFRDIGCYGMSEDTHSYMTRLHYLKLKIQKSNNG